VVTVIWLFAGLTLTMRRYPFPPLVMAWPSDNSALTMLPLFPASVWWPDAMTPELLTMCPLNTMLMLGYRFTMLIHISSPSLSAPMP